MGRYDVITLGETPANPYIAGPPLGGLTGFFGREDILQEVERTLHDPNHNSVILYGQRRIGKTSLLLQLERRLPTPPFFTVYFDLADKALLPVGRVLHQMAVAAADKANIPAPSPEDFENNPAAFDQSFLPALFQALGSRRRPVFLLDEFDIVTTPEQELPETAAVRGLDDYLYTLITRQTYPNFIFAAGRRMDELSSVVESGFKADLTRFVSVLKPEPARALIRQKGVEGIPGYDEAAIECILALTRGHPYLTQLMGQLLFDRAYKRSQRKPRVTVKDVEAVTLVLIETDDNGLPLVWDSLPPAERVTLAAMAGRIKEEGQALSETDLARTLDEAGISPETQGLSQAPKNLVNWQMLEQTGGGYAFFVNLMQRWVTKKRPLAQVKQDEAAKIVLRKLDAGAPAARTAGIRPERRKQRLSLWAGLIITAILVPILCLLFMLGYLPFGTGQAGTATAAAEMTVTRIAATAATAAGGQTGQDTLAPTVKPSSTAQATTAAPPDATAATATAVAAAITPGPTAVASPESQLSGQIRIAGSDTMQPVMADLAAAFTAKHPDVQISIQAGDSKAGLEAVEQGAADVSMLARELEEAELAELGDVQVHTLAENDVIAVIGHVLVPVDNLTSAQVQDIFTGEITNWSELSGVDAPLIVVGRDEDSDTRTVFEQIVLGETGAVAAGDTVIEEPSNQMVRNTVASQPYAIGYLPLNLVEVNPDIPPDSQNWAVVDIALLDVKVLALDQVEPSLENAAGGAYPVVRPLNILTKDPPNDVVQTWLEFISSPESQEIIEQAGHNPAP